MSGSQPSSSESWSLKPTSKRQKKQRKQADSKSAPATPPPETLDAATKTKSITIPPTILAMPPPLRLLVCSIGNPGPYLNTFHSAGHTVLSILSSTSPFYPSFQKSRAYGNGLLSSSPAAEFVLWQSTSPMNVSGPGVAAAWKQFQKENSGAGEGGVRLVVVHDELELGLGEVKVRKGDASAKGHNGLKSIKENVRGEWWRIGVGIGRPFSREPDVVAGYVLRKMGVEEKAKIEGCVGRAVEKLRRLSG